MAKIQSNPFAFIRPPLFLWHLARFGLFTLYSFANRFRASFACPFRINPTINDLKLVCNFSSISSFFAELKGLLYYITWVTTKMLLRTAIKSAIVAPTYVTLSPTRVNLKALLFLFSTVNRIFSAL